MKLAKVISLGLVALFLGACASKQPSQTTSVPTTTATSTTHYPSK